MTKVEVYSSAYCPYCVRAKALLAQKSVEYTEYEVDRDPQLRAVMMDRSKRTSVPQIFIGDQHIGGCDELFALEASNQLDKILSTED
jgi:glutaredoxin 3